MKKLPHKQEVTHLTISAKNAYMNKKHPLLFFFSLLFLGNIITNAQVISIKPDRIVPLNLDHVSPALSALADEDLEKSGPPRKGPENESLKKNIPYFTNDPLPGGRDGALQTNYGAAMQSPAAASVQILSNWAGINPGADPSDNTLAVGPNHVIQMVNGNNTSIRIYNKANGATLKNTNVKAISGKSNAGDPSIIYDYQADRFVFLVISSINSGDLTICVSKTNDPTGQYYIYTLPTGGSFANDFPDYPKLAVWGDSYFVTTNASGPYVYALDRANMLTGATALAAQRFTMKDFPGGGVQACSPVFATGSNTPPTGSKPIIMRLFDAAWTSTGSDVDALELYTMNINWNNPSLSTMTGPTKLTVNAFDSKICNSFNSGTCIPQKNTSKKLDAIGSIIYDKAQYLNFGTHESIVCTYMVDGNNNNVAGVRWYELRRSGGQWSVFQQGTYAPNDNTHRWMASISINNNGTLALGYNVSGSTLFPGIRVTARNSSDGTGLMTAAEAIVQSGTVAKTSSNRYGDYNGMLADPTDGSFWFTANYNPTSSPKTNIVHFKVNSVAAVQGTQMASASAMEPFRSSLQATPNPATGQTTISWQSNFSGTAPLQISDATGRIVLEKRIEIKKGVNELVLSLAGIQAGSYFIKLQNVSEVLTTTLLIQ